MPDLATALKNAINKNYTNKENQMQNQAQHTHSDIKNIVNEWEKDPSDAGPHKARTHLIPITNNVTRATFDCVKENPGLRQARIAEIMESKGYKRDSVCTLMVQMAKVGIMRRTEKGVYYVNQDEYSPIKISHLKAARRAENTVKKKTLALAKQMMKERVAGVKVASADRPVGRPPKTQDAGIAALGAQAGGVIEAKPVITQSFDADQLLSTLSFNQAIALYKKLKTMLGEV